MIEITETAANKVEKLLSSQEDGMHFRIFITGGGCSGFEYGFTFDEDVDEDDIVIEDTITLLVDQLSYQYLDGSQVDYKEDLQGARFLIVNPNAVTTCGCGNSFSI
jgi:iron-sulfur cluster insertion protein